MAKVKYSPLYSTDSPVLGGPLALDRHGKATAEYYDEVSRISFVLSGRDFSYKNGEITHGIVTRIVIENKFGDDYVSISGLHMKVAQLGAGDVPDLLGRSLNGDDTVIGSSKDDTFLFGGDGNNTIIGLNGNDYLVGGTGNDTYTGKLGSDRFAVGYGSGRDVVTDFDARGGGDKQDYLMLTEAPDFRKHQKGDDTVIDFGHHNTVTLLNVDVHDITKADFIYPM